MSQQENEYLDNQSNDSNAEHLTEEQAAQSEAPAVAEETAEARPAQEVNNKVKRTRVGGMWVTLILGAIALILLLIFILQNQDSVDLQMFGWTFSVPAGVGFLFAAIFGALIMACVGAARMFQLRRQIKKRS